MGDTTAEARFASERTRANEESMTQDTKKHPFRRAVLGGLGVVMPPLLTIVLFLWLWNSVENYILRPLGSATGSAIYWAIADVYDTPPAEAKKVPSSNVYLLEASKTEPNERRRYIELPSGQLIPSKVHAVVMKDPGDRIPITARAFYRRYIETEYLPARWMIPTLFCFLILILYLLGKFIAASVGRMILKKVEQIIARVPIISTVYGAVKQVTDLIFSDEEIEFTRVVAVEYPRSGLWSLGFVTGESMLSLREVANEPVLSVLMPTSPMPATGFTVTIRRSEAIDVGITIDQAFQFIVSCGVVVPSAKEPEKIEEELRTMVKAQVAESN